MRHQTQLIHLVMALVVLTLLAPIPAALAQEPPTAIVLDEAGFGLAQMEALAPQAQAAFVLDLKAGDRVTMDLQGETGALQVTEFAAPYGAIVLEGVPEAFNYLGWAPEDGAYIVTVENTGDAAAGFVLRVVVTPAPLPTSKILTLDAAGETIPVMVGEPFQVALDVNAGDGYGWSLDSLDPALMTAVADPVVVPLGTMPGALSQQIFTLQGIAPGATTLAFTNARAGGATPAATYDVTLDVMAADETPAPAPLTLDENGSVQATGTLDPQAMAAYVVDLAEGDAVQAIVTPADTDLVLTVVGADGYPLLTDHAGASSFDQTMPVSQAYTFKVINFGAAAQEYTFDLTATAADDDELGRELVDQFFATLQSGDKEQLATLLAPAFQLLRSNGESFDAATYPDIAPVYEAYMIDNLHATRDGDVLVAVYTARTDTTLDGGEADFSADAPRLTVFQQIDGAWKLLAHANFGAPVDNPDLGEFIPPPSAIVITEDDNDETVEVAAGGSVAVELPGNPTTGYIWQVTANDASILNPLGYEFTPDSDAVGAGGVERFEFAVMAPGVVDLEFANSRPWETDTPPAQTFAVTVGAVNEWSGEDASITVGMAENGATVSILPGNVLLVALEGAERGDWQLVQNDAMVTQMLGGPWVYPGAEAGTALYKHFFLGVGAGTSELQFAFINPDGSPSGDTYSLSVEVPATPPGTTAVVSVTEADAGGNFDLVTGDTFVVRLAGNPTTGYDWRVVSTNDGLLPAAGDPDYAVSTDLTGAGGVYTFRFLAKAAGEATVQMGEFPPGATDSERTLDFNVYIVEPAPLTGNTVAATADDNGKVIDLAAGDMLDVTLDENASTGYVWRIVANDGAVLRPVPTLAGNEESTGGLPGAPGAHVFLLRALQPGAVTFQIGLFPPGAAAPEEIFELDVTVN